MRVNFDRFADSINPEGKETSVYSACARARPTDRHMTKVRLGRPTGDSTKTPIWARDACAYCSYRPIRAPNAGQPWLTGTGNGMHNPYFCDAFKRYLAKGGEPSNTPAEKQFLQSVLHHQAARTN